jgi:D-glycero-alpha-D-manno-heptose 1-phosphate guanylyltransferase
MITEAIILAGGLGTRLRTVVENVPKCLAPINDIPFIEYVLQYGHQQGIERFIISVGYKKELVKFYIASQEYPFDIIFCEEDEPLGTGGAIKKSLGLTQTGQILILNGDTFFEYNLQDLSMFHEFEFAECTLCLKPLTNFDRYGAVEFLHGDIIGFKEKKFTAKGYINAGVYALEKFHFLDLDFPTTFSFEKDYLEKYVKKLSFQGVIQKEYFIDIGIPEDFAKAQIDLKNKL